MRIHCLRHVPFEDEAEIVSWARSKGHPLSGTNLYAGEQLPDLAQVDLLVVMGGPMGVSDEHLYPWISAEKKFIGQAVAKKKKILGICLGAQLLAEVLGGIVTKNPEREIGWFPVTMTPAGQQHDLFHAFPAIFPAFHWHGDTFSIPLGAVHVATSEACQNQAFVFEDRVVGLQFHLEASAQSMEQLITHCGAEIVPGRFIQSTGKLRSAAAFPEINNLMGRFLDAFVAETP